MDLTQLRGFVAVAETGQLTRAADRLHLSQPALSAQIKGLEQELGHQLFARSSSGMVLTPVGRDLLESAQKVLAAAEDLRLLARRMRGEVSGKLRLGTLSDPHFIRIGELLALALERYPHLDIELHNYYSSAAFEAVREGEVDAGFYFGDLSQPSVAALRLAEMGYRVVAPGGWNSDSPDADQHDVAAMTWIMGPAGSTHNQLVRAYLADQRIEPARVVEADTETLIAHLVESGVGLSLLREDVAWGLEAHHALSIVGGSRHLTTLWFLYPADRGADPLLGAVLDILRTVWGLPEPVRGRRGRQADDSLPRRP